MAQRQILHFTVLMLGLLLGGTSGCGKGDTVPTATVPETGKKSERSAETSTSVAPAKLPEVEIKLPPLAERKSTRPAPAEIIPVSAEALADEVRKDTAAAGKKYAAVQVEVSGVVRAVGSRGSETFVTLDAGVDPLGILCVFADEKEPWARISRGQKLKLRGLWPETLVQTGLVECTIAELGPSPAQQIDAESLSVEFAKDADKKNFLQKYSEKTLIVHGVIVDSRPNELGAIRVFLKGAGDTRIDCGFNAVDKAEASALQKGQTVRLVGEFAALESQSGPALRGCRVITTPK